MLIVCQPRTASTSLTALLNRLSGLDMCQHPPDVPNLPGSRYVAESRAQDSQEGTFVCGCSPLSPVGKLAPVCTGSSNPDIRNFRPLYLRRAVQDRTTIYKHHVPPTYHNRKFVLQGAQESGEPVIFLHRSRALLIIKSLWKATQTGDRAAPYFLPDKLQNIGSLSDWISAARQRGVITAFESFRDEWFREADRDKRDRIGTVSMGQVLNETTEVVTSIRDLWGLKLDSEPPYTLPEKRKTPDD